MTSSGVRARPGYRTIARPRLSNSIIDSLADVDGSVRVVLMCAPAGSGKTRLLHDCADSISNRIGGRIVWVDVADDTAPQFSESVGFGTDDDPAWLLLDDAHLLTDRSALDELANLLRTRSTLRAIVAGRFEPPLALQHLRLDGRLFELHSENLAFDAAEATELLAQHGVRLDTDALHLLMERTEGWVAGLRLAALSLTGRADKRRFLEAFRGDRRPVADYLFEEVFSDLSTATRDFLVSTSVPDEFTADLADMLTGRCDAQQQLQWLDRHNYMLTCTPDSPVRYRYHPLFRSYLKAELGRRGREAITALEKVVTRWHLDFGEPLVALEHAANVEDRGEVRGLLARHGLSLVLDGHGEALESVLGRTPNSLRDLPEARTLRAATLLVSGRHVAARSILDNLPSALGHETGVLAKALTIESDLTSEPHTVPSPIDSTGNLTLDAFAALQRGRALLSSGASDDGTDALRRAREYAEQAGNSRLVRQIESAAALSDMMRGELPRPRPVAHAPTSVQENAGEALAALGEAWMLHEQLHDDHAERLAHRSHELAGAPLSDLGRFSRAAEETFALDDDRDRLGAVSRIHKAMHPLPRAIPAPLLLSLSLGVQRAYLSSGQQQWANELIDDLREVGSPSPDLDVMRAVTALHRHRWESASHLVAPVLTGSVRCLTRGSLVVAWVIDAVACEEADRHPRAVESLRTALELAEPGDIRGPFVCEGRNVRDLLAANRDRPRGIGAFAASIHALLPLPAVAGPELTKRERELLPELVGWRAADEIASDLGVSVNTVKTHLRGIYRKLGVNSRHRAIVEARRRGLV